MRSDSEISKSTTVVSPSTSGDEQPAKILKNNSDILGICGFALYLAWLFLILANTLLMNSGIPKNEAVGVIAFFFLGELVASFVVWFLSKHLMSKAAVRTVALVIMVLTPIPAISTFFSDPPKLLLVFIWFAAGFGAVCLLSLWGIFLSRLNHKRALVYPAVSMVLQAITILVVLYFFKTETVKIVMIILPCFSVVLFESWEHLSRMEQDIPSYYSTRPPDWRSLLHSSIAMVANGFLLGFVFFCLSITSLPIIGICVLLTMLISLVFRLYDALHNQRFEVNMIIKVLAPTAAIGLLLIPMIPLEFRVLCLVIMIFIATWNESICWSAVSEYMFVYQLIPFANMAFGRMGDIIGLFWGYFCGYLVFGTSLEGNLQLVYVLSLVVIVFNIMQAFLFRNNYVPFTDHPDLYREYGPSRDDSKPVGHWKRKCTSFSNFYHLTPRQQEVLILLAKGYSTSYIEKELVVSEYTVKAHIYGIYRKTEVHSRQELIELIEDFAFNDDEDSDIITEQTTTNQTA